MWKRLAEEPRVRAWVSSRVRRLQQRAPEAWSTAFRAQKLGESLWASAREMRDEARKGLDDLGGPRGVATGWVAGDVSARGAWERLRQRSTAAWRTGVVDAEVMEAFQVYLAHEHHVNVYRAQGVLVLKILERDAEALLSSLPPHRREQLREMALKIRDAGLRTGELTRGDAQCGQCTRKLAPELKGGDCCGGMVFLAWDEVDAVFRVLLGERAPVPLTFSGDPTRCGFVGEKGCLLTPGTRPTVCTAYYCPSYKQDLVAQERWEELSKTLLELNDGRRGMNFRLNLSRRFVLGQSTKAGSTHPLDFIWDRLRLSGADVGAAGKRRDHGRLNVVR